jgi:hypothetical protein
MRISRTRVALSGVLGLTAAIVALGMTTLLDHQGDPALAQSTDLRARFTPPSGSERPTDALRTPKPAPRVQIARLAAPAPAQPAPTATSAESSAAAPPAAVVAEPAPAVQVAQFDDGAQDRGDDGEHDGGDD